MDGWIMSEDTPGAPVFTPPPAVAAVVEAICAQMPDEAAALGLDGSAGLSNKQEGQS